MSERGAGLLAIDARTKIDVSIKRRQQGRQQEKGQTDCRTRGRRKIKKRNALLIEEGFDEAGKEKLILKISIPPPELRVNGDKRCGMNH